MDSICAFSGKHDGVTADGGRSVPYAAKRGGRCSAEAPVELHE